jgi:hypothetical protein
MLTESVNHLEELRVKDKKKIDTRYSYNRKVVFIQLSNQNLEKRNFKGI